VSGAKGGQRGRDNDRRISDSALRSASRIAREETMGEESAFRVLIADDHPLMVGGLRQAVLAAAPNAEIVVTHDFDSKVAALNASPDADLGLLDLAMPGEGVMPED
jgi:PleD family two-component response regulator